MVILLIYLHRVWTANKSLKKLPTMSFNGMKTTLPRQKRRKSRFVDLCVVQTIRKKCRHSCLPPVFLYHDATRHCHLSRNPQLQRQLLKPSTPAVFLLFSSHSFDFVDQNLFLTFQLIYGFRQFPFFQINQMTCFVPF